MVAIVQRLRVFFALLWTFVAGVPLLVALLLLLPWRRGRVIVSTWYGWVQAWGALRCFGVQVDVRGRDRLKAPAIFIMNHSSPIDAFTALRVVPLGTVGVAKQQIVKIPAFGQLYWLSGHLLLERSDHRDAVARLKQTAAFMARNRFGCWLFPEGTMPHEPVLMPYKPGFVHMALATGLPVVPVVLHGARELWPPRTLNMRPGRVVLEVLEPIDASAWSEERAREHAAEVRDMVLAKLEAGPPA